MKLKAVVGILATCVATNALADTPDLFLGAYGGSTETLFKESIIPLFQKKHDVNVVYVAGNSTDTVAKLMAQRSKPEFDVALIDDGPLAQAVQFGLCGKLDPAPVYEDLYPLARLGDKALALGIIATGIFYNAEVFKAQGIPAPTSWEDLTNPIFKDKLVIPPISNGYGLHALIKFAQLRGGGENNIDPGFDAMVKEVGPNVLAWEPSPGKMTELFQNGAGTIGVWGSGRVEALKDTGFPVEFVYPKEGSIALMTGVCAVAGKGENNPMAQAFIQHLFSPEVQQLLAAGQAWGPVNSKVVLDDEVASKVPYGLDQINKLEKVDWDIINEKRPEWTNRWNRTVER